MNIKKAKEFCRSLPGVTEDIKWGEHLVFCIGEKMFAVTDLDEKSTSIRFKAEDERFLELTDRPGITAAAYLARAKWINVENIGKLSDAEAKELLRRAYELIFAKLTKKLQREIEGAA